MIEVRVYGLPIPQGRPRASRTRDGGVRMRDPDTSRDWKRTVLAQVLPSRPSAPLEGPLALRLTFFLPRPASLPRRVQHHTRRPDLDNLVKAVADALRGVVYHDDAQVTSLWAAKQYDATPGVAIRVEPLPC